MNLGWGLLVGPPQKAAAEFGFHALFNSIRNKTKPKKNFMYTVTDWYFQHTTVEIHI